VHADPGADVTLAVRDTYAGATVAANICGSTGSNAVDMRPVEPPKRLAVHASAPTPQAAEGG